MTPNDEAIWNQSYMEEYLGLHETTHTWDYITEEEYLCLKKVLGKPLLTMAISKIKKDSNGNPQCAKYRIVVLGNLDPHNWSSSDCFAPPPLSPQNKTPHCYLRPNETHTKIRRLRPSLLSKLPS